MTDWSDLICSANRALWGEVGPNLRAVTASKQDHTIRFQFLIDGEPSKEDRDSASFVAGLVAGDFPDAIEVDEELIRIDAPEPIKIGEGWRVIFMRREPQ